MLIGGVAKLGIGVEDQRLAGRLAVVDPSQ